VARFDALCREIAAEFPGFRVIPKEGSPLMRAIYQALGMRLWNRDFLTGYTTVILYRVYMPRALIGTDAGFRALRHERVHMRDARRTAVVPFVVSYLLLLPAVFTARAFWEFRAYVETMRVEIEETGDVSDDTLEHIARRFTGSDYLFMCPFPRFIRGRLRRARERLRDEARGRPATRPPHGPG